MLKKYSTLSLQAEPSCGNIPYVVYYFSLSVADFIVVLLPPSATAHMGPVSHTDRLSGCV